MAQQVVAVRRSVRARLGAEIIGVSESSFWRYAKDDPTFPCAFKVGVKTTTFYVDELVAWRERHKVAKPPTVVDEPFTQADMLEQLRGLLAGRGTVAELMPGSNAFLVTVAPTKGPA